MTGIEATSARDYDVLIVGAGTAGMETALSLGDMGYRVLLVEKEPSVGGKTILLSKVFPTLDCASCISTPKMAASAHHPNITLLVYSEVDDIARHADGTFRVTLHKKPTFVDWDKCTGCAKCEMACTVAVPDQYNYDLVARRAAHIAFPQAVPKKSVIERHGSAPCTFTCPAGVNPSGFVSLVRSGKYKEAFELHMENAPLVGALSRTCYAPCEGACTRGEFEGAVQIRAVKRFMVDRYYSKHPEPEYGPPEKLLDTRVAIVGSGPAGLSAAYFLARKGHRVTVFEAEPKAGGMLRHGIPAYRMPKDLLDRDIKNVTALGVEIRTNAPVASLASLKAQGFDAVFIAVGGQIPRIVAIEGQELVDIDNCMTFLKQASRHSELPQIAGKHVVVIGGGDVAMDVARTALRLGGESVTIVYRRSRGEMPAHEFEVAEAEAEGVRFFTSASVTRVFRAENGQPMLEFAKTTALDSSSGEMKVTTEAGSERQIRADVVILAIGLAPTTAPFENEIALKSNKTIRVDEETLATSMPSVFAGGDAATGPSIIVRAIGQAKRAAFYIDRYLKGEPMDDVRFDERMPMADKRAVVARSAGLSERQPKAVRLKPAQERIQSFEPYEGALTEAEARAAANRCLDCGGCSQCRQCVSVCPAGAIDFSMKPEAMTLTVGSVVLATGYDILDPALKPALGFGRYPNVITAPQMDRLLAPTRPYNGVLRPSDGKEPENIAFVLCMGARDHTVCNPLCCRIGCMYAAKHAQLVMGALPLADVTVYYIDIRAFGKGYEEFFQQAKGMGVNYVKGKVARIEESENHDLIVHYEDIAGGQGHRQARHDMVVISVGLVPNTSAMRLFSADQLDADDLDYIREVDEVADPGRTSVDGVFAAGTVSGARDIPDTVLHSGAAAAQVAAYLERLKHASRELAVY